MINTKNNIYSPEELALFLKEYGISKGWLNRGIDTFKIGSVISQKIVEERNKLTHNGMFHNSGNRDSFLKLLSKKMGKKIVSKFEFGDYTEVKISDENHDLQLQVYQDHISVNFGSYSDKVYFGLHSNFYEEVLSFLFDVDNDFNKLVQHYHRLCQSISYYNSLFDKVTKEDNFISSLTDKSQYDQFMQEFEYVISSLQSLGEYFNLSKWDESLRAYGVVPSVNEISAVRRLASGKPLDKCSKYQKRYEKALAALTGANEYGLLAEEELKLLQPWSDFISTVAGEDAMKSNTVLYISSVEKAFIDAIQQCYLSNTPYMRKKRLRMEANIEMCKKLKDAHGLYCFIDNSYYDSKTGHFNIVTEDNQVWVFRTARETPSFDEGTVFINIVKTLTQVSKILNKGVKLKEVGQRKSGKLALDAYGIDKAIVTPIYELTKKIKNGRLDFTSTSFRLAIPVGDLEWQISIRKNKAQEVLSEIMPYIIQYQDLSKNGVGIDVKGIYKERKPNL